MLHVMLLVRHRRDLRRLSGDTLSDELSYHSLKLLITSLELVKQLARVSCEAELLKEALNRSLRKVKAL